MAYKLDLMDYKQIITFHMVGSSNRRIASTLGISRNTVNTYIRSFQASAYCFEELLSFGLQSFNNHGREALMDIIDDRYNKSSTIISSQIPMSAWYDVNGEGTIADAILDRIVNSSHRIDLKGDSSRRKIYTINP